MKPTLSGRFLVSWQIGGAKAHKAQVIAEAVGESNRFLALLGEYQKAPEVTRERLYLETVQDVMSESSKVLLDVREGSNLTYLPLDRMILPGKGSRSSREADLPGYDTLEIEEAKRRAAQPNQPEEKTRSRRSR